MRENSQKYDSLREVSNYLLAQCHLSDEMARTGFEPARAEHTRSLDRRRADNFPGEHLGPGLVTSPDCDTVLG